MRLKNFWLSLIESEETGKMAFERWKWYHENVVCLSIQNQEDFFDEGHKEIEKHWPNVKVIK
jgi:hypothetical protein